MRRKAVLITGCDSGFGYSLALHSTEDKFIEKNFIIIATCLLTDGPGSVALRGHPRYCSDPLDVQDRKNLFVIPLDVTKDVSIECARDRVDEILKATESDLWCVINNAASPIVFGDAIWLTRPMVTRQYEVSVIGAWAVSQAFSPHLIKSKGRIVNMISYCTECPMPTLSIYTSTKAALKTLSDAMRMELKKHSVDVVLFNPGDRPMETNLCAGQNFAYEEMSPNVTSRFGNDPEIMDTFSSYQQKFENLFPAKKDQKITIIDSPGLYAEYERILFEVPSPRKYEYVNSDWGTWTFFTVLKYLPTFLSDKIRTLLMRLPVR